MPTAIAAGIWDRQDRSREGLFAPGKMVWDCKLWRWLCQRSASLPQQPAVLEPVVSGHSVRREGGSLRQYGSRSDGFDNRDVRPLTFVPSASEGSACLLGASFFAVSSLWGVK